MEQHDTVARLIFARDQARAEAVVGELMALAETSTSRVRQQREEEVRAAVTRATAIEEQRVARVREEATRVNSTPPQLPLRIEEPRPITIAEATIASMSTAKALELAMDRAREVGSTPAAKLAAEVAIEEAARHRQIVRHGQLRLDYDGLATAIAPYDELKRRTRAFNAGMRDIYGLGRGSLTYAGLRLDAEHFIDQRFFKTYANKFAALGIHSPGEMPTFAVHYEYHLRSPSSLSADAELNEDEELQGSSLTQEKLLALPHDDALTLYPTLLSLLEKFADFWRAKAGVTVRGETHDLAQGYWSRLEPEFVRLIADAKRLGL